MARPLWVPFAGHAEWDDRATCSGLRSIGVPRAASGARSTPVWARAENGASLTERFHAGELSI